MKLGLNRYELDHIYGKMEEIRNKYTETFPEAEVVYDVHTREYEVYADFSAYKKKLEPIAVH